MPCFQKRPGEAVANGKLSIDCDEDLQSACRSLALCERTMCLLCTSFSCCSMTTVGKSKVRKYKSRRFSAAHCIHTALRHCRKLECCAFQQHSAVLLEQKTDYDIYACCINSCNDTALPWSGMLCATSHHIYYWWPGQLKSG